MTVPPPATTSTCNEEETPTAIDNAKKSIAPRHELNEWLTTSSSSQSSAEVVAASSQSIHVSACNDSDDNTGGSTVTFEYDDNDVMDDGGGKTSIVFRDNVIRISGCLFKNDIHGDNLPHVPTVLTGLMDDWPAFLNSNSNSNSNSNNSEGGTTTSWSVEDLAAREATTTSTPRVSLDGGPSFARMSMCQGKVTLEEYNQYCKSGEADNDVAPLYVFDPDILKSSTKFFTSNEFSIPECFSNDVMGCINGTEYRPLPPAWLLIGVTRSGTPIHDHPLTVAWNALLVGCKLWCCLPPDVDESLLLLNLPENENDNESENDEDEDFVDLSDFDLSALEWFKQCGSSSSSGSSTNNNNNNKIPECAKIIVQRPGEVVYLPVGWFHVVLNVADDSDSVVSTAISVSLTLRRDLPVILPQLMESDEAFARFWINRLSAEQKEHIPSLLLETEASSSSSSSSSSEDR
jgi:hypothetical protein